MTQNLTKNKEWLNTISSIKDANTKCISKIFTELGQLKQFRLEREEINNTISEEICADTLLNEDIMHLVNKRSYKSIEKSITKFKSFYEENSKLTIEAALDKWLSKKENFTYHYHKEIILKRVKESNRREIATDQSYTDDQINTFH